MTRIRWRETRRCPVLESCGEEGGIGCQGDSREVILEEGCVTGSVGWTVKNGVDVMEDVFWAECREEVAVSVGYPGELEKGLQG